MPVHPGLLLGVRPEQDYRERTSLLPASCCLLLVTDGLIDDFPGAMYSDLDTLAATAYTGLHPTGLHPDDGSPDGGGTVPLEVLADHLSHSRPGASALRDDAAFLLARLTTATSDAIPCSVARTFGPYPAACMAARCGGFVVGGAGLEAAVQDAGQVVGELAQPCLPG